MKRIVTYIYEYDGKIRKDNAGYIRTDLRDDSCRLEAHVRLNERADGTGRIFLVADESSPVGIPAGELVLSQGQGHVRLNFPQNILGKSGYAVAQLIAFAVRFDDGRLLAASFAGESGECAACGDFPVWEPADTKAESPDTEPAPTDEAPNPTDAEPAPATDEIPDSPDNDLSALEVPQTALCRISLTDLFSLSGANRRLCRNSFLVHGYFNYRYLIEKTVTLADQTTRYIGVPGIYSPPERRMAEMYGFPDFERAGQEPDGSGGTPENFGYWLRQL